MLAATLTMTACDGPKNTGEEKTQEPKSVAAVVPLTPQEAKEHVATLDSLRRAAYQEAVWIIPPLAATVVVIFFYQHFVNVEFYFEESKMTSYASAGAALMNIGLNFLLIPVFGYLAAGYTTLASYMLFAVIHYIFMKKVCVS